MFTVGDYIIYGSNGVCKVEAVGLLDMSGIPKDRQYYTLQPIYAKTSKFFTPIDNDKVVMRKILTKQEAQDLIDGIQDIELFWEDDVSKRDDIYKESMRKCDCTEWIRIIKTLYQKKMTRLAEGKKVTTGDEKYLRQAEENLYGELAVALGINRDEVKDYIINRVEG